MLLVLLSYVHTSATASFTYTLLQLGQAASYTTLLLRQTASYTTLFCADSGRLPRASSETALHIQKSTLITRQRRHCMYHRLLMQPLLRVCSFSIARLEQHAVVACV
jgi:hypothetical protein